jgi:hypothetical protein
VIERDCHARMCFGIMRRAEVQGVLAVAHVQGIDGFVEFFLLSTAKGRAVYKFYPVRNTAF